MNWWLIIVGEIALLLIFGVWFLARQRERWVEMKEEARQHREMRRQLIKESNEIAERMGFPHTRTMSEVGKDLRCQ